MATKTKVKRGRPKGSENKSRMISAPTFVALRRALERAEKRVGTLMDRRAKALETVAVLDQEISNLTGTSPKRGRPAEAVKAAKTTKKAAGKKPGRPAKKAGKKKAKGSRGLRTGLSLIETISTNIVAGKQYSVTDFQVLAKANGYASKAKDQKVVFAQALSACVERCILERVARGVYTKIVATPAPADPAPADPAPATDSGGDTGDQIADALTTDPTDDDSQTDQD